MNRRYLVLERLRRPTPFLNATQGDMFRHATNLRCYFNKGNQPFRLFFFVQIIAKGVTVVVGLISSCSTEQGYHLVRK